MFENRFFQMLQQYPEAVNNKKVFIGLLKDYFPEQPMQVNLIITAYELGITNDLSTVKAIDNTFAFRYVKRLLDEYGVSRVNADWAISIWCVCYGKKILNKTCDIQISKAQKGAAPAIRSESSSVGRQYNDLFQYRSIADDYGISGFSGDNMRTLIIPNSYLGKPVKRVLSGAFESCDVREVVMTAGITVIEDAAFKSCRQLNQVILPPTLKEIGNEALADCRSLVTAALPFSTEQIGCCAFEGTSLRQVDLPDSILWLGTGVYKNCKKLSLVHLPRNMRDIPAECFKGCSSLRKMDLPDGLQSIGREAFSGCSELIDLIVPDSVTTVEDNAFSGMNPLFSLICTQKSAAERYARTHNVPFQIVL